MDSLVTIDTRRFLGQGPDTYSPLTATQGYMLKTRPANSFETNHPAFPPFSHRECRRRGRWCRRCRRCRPYSPVPLRCFFPLLCFTNSDVYRGKSRGRTGLKQRVLTGTRKIYVASFRVEKKKRFPLLDESTGKSVYVDVCTCLPLYRLAFIRISTRCEISNRNCILNVSHAIEINDVLSRACSRDGWEKKERRKRRMGRYIYIYKRGSTDLKENLE